MLDVLSINGLSVSKSTVASQLHLGDCLDILQKLPDKSIDCIVTDPPYGINYKSLSHKLPLRSIANDKREAYKLLDDTLALVYDKLKPNSHIYIFTNWQAYHSMAEVVKKYFNLKNVLIWEKNSNTRGDLKGNYGYKHEMIMYAHKGRRFLNGRRDGNILKFNKVPSAWMLHPTEKPIELLEYLIQKSTNMGETVLDMFAGSGSTLVAAKNVGREYIGIELEKAWHDVAQKRLAGL